MNRGEAIATIAVRESETTRMGEGCGSGVLIMNWREKRIENTSAENIDVVGESLNDL